jgi:hypothetical protein
MPCALKQQEKIFLLLHITPLLTEGERLFQRQIIFGFECFCATYIDVILIIFENLLPQPLGRDQRIQRHNHDYHDWPYL